MPRVSEAHLAARRDQIIEAATRCFARNGFHATSMQDVIREAGLSVGAVYRYFDSKGELRRAIAEQAVGTVSAELATLAAHDPPLPLAEVMTRVLELVEPRLGPEGEARIAIAAWAEALHNAELAEFVRGVMWTFRGQFTTLAHRARTAGELPAGADPEAVASVLVALLPGYMVQRVLSGGPDRATFAAGITALLTVGAADKAGAGQD
jgi:AcrR family transcriptional regulator